MVGLNVLMRLCDSIFVIYCHEHVDKRLLCHKSLWKKGWINKLRLLEIFLRNWTEWDKIDMITVFQCRYSRKGWWLGSGCGVEGGKVGVFLIYFNLVSLSYKTDTDQVFSFVSCNFLLYRGCNFSFNSLKNTPCILHILWYTVLCDLESKLICLGRRFLK